MMINTSKNGRILRRRKTGVKEDVSGVKTVFNKTGARFLLAFLLLITFFSGYAAGVDSFSVSSTSEGYKAEQVTEKQLDWEVSQVRYPGSIAMPNYPPKTPKQPSGTSSGCQVGESYIYSTSTTDDDGDLIRYTFNWSDGSDDTTSYIESGVPASAAHTWTKPRTYQVEVMATDSKGAKSGWSTSLTVKVVNTPPDPPRKPSGPSSGQAGISYTYSTSADDPDGDQVKYIFDWGDGNTSMTEAVGSGETVSLPHAWDTSREYRVRVNATDANGASSEWSEPLVVVVGTEEQIPPTAIIAVDPTELNESEIVSLSADESSDQNGEIVSYEWDFGDGSTGTGVNVDHVYTRSGEYTATLMVTDNDDLSTTNRVDITVRAPPDDPLNMRPTANATISRDEPVEGTSVTFEGRGVDEDGEVVECRWIFPDGQIRSYSGSSSSFTLEDAPAGEYRFAVMDDAGAWSEEDAVNLLYSKSELPILVIIALLAIAAIVAVVYWYFRIRPEPDTNGDGEFGSISVTSNPDGATVLLDGVDKGKSQLQMDAVSVGSHIVLFTKSGYSDCKKEVVVDAKQTTSVHCDLKKPEMKLRLSAEPNEIPADGKSKSVITISVEDENGTPAPVPEETEITLETDIGLIDTPVSIPAGDAQTRSILTSSTASGTATVRAKSELGLESSVAVRFV